MRTGSCCLRVAGTLSLACGALLGALWIPVTVCFWLFSVFYPFLNLHRCGSDAAGSELGDGTDLACALTAVQACGMLMMLGLLPAVRRWQVLRMDLIGLGGFPQCFYGDDVLAEMVRRARHSLELQAAAAQGDERDRRAVRRQQEQQRITDNPITAGAEAFGTTCTICLEALDLDEPDAAPAAKSSMAKAAPRDAGGEDDAIEAKVVVALPVCMHAFHKECIYEWLGANRSCPNCRADVVRVDAASGGAATHDV